MRNAFFRIKQNLIKERNYREYIIIAIGEILLIVIGILIALQIDNWNQVKQENRIIEAYLIRIQSDLSKDLNDIMELKKRHQERISKVQRFIDYFGKDTISLNTFNNLYWSTHHADDFIPHDDTYFDMVNTGSLDLISNEELKMKILEIYSHYEKLNHFEDHLARDNRDNIYSLSIKLFDYEVTLGNDRNQFLKEFKKISNSLQMKNAYIMFNAVSGTMTELYTTGISKINQLDSLINIEIN